MGYAYSKIPTQVKIAGKIDPSIILTNAAADYAFETSTYFTTQFQTLSAYTVLSAFLDVTVKSLENTAAGLNWTNGAQSIQVQSHTGGTWTDAIYVPTVTLVCAAASVNPGTVLYGQNDIKTEVQLAIDNSTYLDIRWHDGRAASNTIVVNDLQPVVRVLVI